jgi:TPR repeat protein
LVKLDQDDFKALKFFQKACGLNDGSGCSNLGLSYEGLTPLPSSYISPRLEQPLPSFKSHAFNQDISSWDISSLTNAAGMFKGTAMTVVLIKGVCVIKHPRHISHIANIPTTNVLIKGICIRKWIFRV